MAQINSPLIEEGAKPSIPEYQSAASQPYGFNAGYQPPPQLHQPPDYPQPSFQPAPSSYQPAPPQYNYPPPFQQQQQNTNVVVVGQQTAPSPVVIETRPVGDHFLTLSVIMVILSACCGMIFLVCTIPAVVFAMSARDDDRCGRTDSAQTKGRIALGLNVATVISWVLAVVINIIVVVVTINNYRVYNQYDN